MIFWHHPQFLNIYHPQKDLLRLFLSSVSRRVSQTFVSVFSSVYIYNLMLGAGYSSKFAVISVLAFHCVIFFVKYSTLFAAEKYSLRFGFKRSIYFSFIPFLFSITSIIFASQYMNLIWMGAAFWGIHAGFYWWGYHGYFVKSGDGEHFGQIIGEVELLQTLAAILSPIVGSVVVGIYGFNSLFGLSVIFMMISILLLKSTEEKKQKTDIDVKELFSSLKKHYKVSLAYVAGGIENGAYVVIWPLFLYLTFNSIVEMGGIISIAVALAAVFGLVAGDIEDKKGERKLIHIGTPLVATSWLIRSFLSTAPVYVIADSLWNFGQKMVALPLGALTYKKATEKKAAKAILFRETGLNLGALIGFLMLILVYYFTESFQLLFLIVALVSVLPLASLFSEDLDE